MNGQTRLSSVITVFAVALLVAFAVPVAAEELPSQLPDPDGKPGVATKPVKVYILSGQSNMVGMGDIRGGSSRWGSQVLEPVVSVYPGAYSPAADYDKMIPVETKALPVYGGVKPTPFPGGGTQVVRGHLQIKTSGVYEFNVGYSASMHNIMEVDGVEVYRKDVGKKVVRKAFRFTAGKKYPFKITFLTNAANGLGWLWRTDVPGLLETLVKKEKKFPHLIDNQGNWTVRNDVMYKGVVSAATKGPLTVGIQGNTIGPELQFGHILGYYHDEPVLLIKASQGNRSLAWDILPPGSKRYTIDGTTYAGYKDGDPSWTEQDPYKDIKVWYAGKQYDDFVREIHGVLDNFDTLFPTYKDQGYEIAGFAWWQGHKDGNPAHASRYEQNLVNLIKTFRSEFQAPKAPFVIATIGFGGWEMAGPHLTVANAQLAVSGEKGKYPEFADNVLTVETRGFWKDTSVSPSGQGYHYNRNAETYMMVGDALGRGMVKLLETKD
jgi:alpha-galactosidase